MSGSSAQVELDLSLLRAIDAAAQRSGRTRREVLDDFVRRGLAASILGDILARSRAGATLSVDEAADLAGRELKAARAERRDRPPSTGRPTDSGSETTSR
jgi:hypothetical protein